MDRLTSDHCPILLKDEEKDFWPKPFKIFDSWMDEPEFSKIVANSWSETVSLGSMQAGHKKDFLFLSKLKHLKVKLRSRSKEKFGKLDQDIEGEAELQAWKENRKIWAEKEKMKRKMLKQKSRIRWAIEGDENTKIFHTIIRNNYNKNNIRGLTINSQWNENPNDIKDKAFSHFRKLFEEIDHMRPSLENLQYPSISSEDASALECRFSEKEVYDAIHDCADNKAPDPDGYNLRFYKKFWDIVKDVLVDAINWYWEYGEITKGCNASFVTLIPKKMDPVGLGDFRPISLIGSYYKIVSKILSNRLWKVIPSLVGSEQSAFLKGRYILDGVLIANETIDFLKVNKKKGIIFKMDFEKAFDSINWCFLMEVMKSVEGLNILTKIAVEKGLFKGIDVGNDKVIVSHLQYADDTIFFGEWSRVNVNSLGCKVGKFPCTYIGLPIGSKMNRAKDWCSVIEKFNSRLSGWEMRSLSFGGRLVLIKSVLNSLPLYYFSFFRAPPCVNKILERVRRSFFGVGLGLWRFKTETTSLWAKVIRSIYGFCRGLTLGDSFTHQSTLGTWRNIVLTGKSLEDLHVPFSNSFVRKIEDGGTISFWNEQWINGGKLCNLFLRLYRLESNTAATVKDQVKKKIDGSFVFAWSWNRDPIGRTWDELMKLEQAVMEVEFDGNSSDAWKWTLSNSNIFEVRKLAQVTDENLLGITPSHDPHLLNNLVPKKIEIFMWRARKKRLPVRVELDKRGIDLDNVRCPVCNEDLESVDHTLLFCKHARDVWERVFKWWGLNVYSSFSISELVNDVGNTIASSLGAKVWQATRWITMYQIWKNRNNSVFLWEKVERPDRAK
ncbi:uncharacterized protein [Rutidosis leptorrhynchoides]|uniref:uncharacterized protein n=1 Tax=Rutidosis leptorrhynchoides TaxID=125765 RepID=UPI003A9A57F7